MAARLLETFEQQYAKLTADITSKTGKILHLTGEERKTLIEDVRKHLEEAKELLEQMELTVQEMPLSERPRYQNHVRSYKAELARLNQDLKHANISSDDDHSREELLGHNEYDDQRALLINNMKRLENSSRALDEGYRLAIESEQLGADILNNLNTQRETIVGARRKLQDTGRDLGKSTRILNSMVRRIIQNRLILYLVATIVLLAIAAGIYVAVT